MTTADQADRPLGAAAAAAGQGAGDGGSAIAQKVGQAKSALARMAERGGATTVADNDATAPVEVRSTAVNGGPDSVVNGSGEHRTVEQREQRQPERATSSAPTPAPVPRPGRRVRLTVSRIDPWSAMKISFLLSVALGIALVVMTAVLWTVLDAMGVFDQVNGLISQVTDEGSATFDIYDFVGFAKVVSLSVVFAVIDVILLTAVATLGAFIYNVSSALVGGVELTLTDD